MISQTLTLALVAAFGAAMFTGTRVRRQVPTLDRFLVAQRNMGVGTGAMSVASTWIWAPALFIAAQKAYQQGVAGLFWFTLPNVGCLILFAFLARRIRRLFPRGYTLPQYVAQRFDRPCHLIYLFTFLSLQVCALAVQLIAGAAMLDAMSGLPYLAGVLILAAIFSSYSLMDGLRASIRTDMLQLLLILAGMALLIPLAIAKAGGLSAVGAGLGGKSGQFIHPLDPQVAYSFGITVTIGLMSGPVGDQQHWQRAFAFAPHHAFGGYMLGALIFALVPLGMGLLGFVAAGAPWAVPELAAGAISAQQAGPEVIRGLLPPWAMLVFMGMVLSGLASTGDSALCAAGSLVSVDIYHRYLNPGADEARILSMARTAILGVTLLAVGIALIPGITILGLFLFYGTLRSATWMPTLLILFKKNLSSSGIFWGVGLAIGVGLPLYLAGEFQENVDLKVAANLAILLISLFLPWMAGHRKKEKRRQQDVMPPVQKKP